MRLMTEGPWERVLTPKGWVVEGPPVGAEGNPPSLICSVPLGGNAQAISATPNLIRATRLGLEWAPTFLRADLEEALVKAGVMERGAEIQPICSEPGCSIPDGTVTRCDRCPRLVCTEHRDVRRNRDVPSNQGGDPSLNLCMPCGERHDHQAMREIVSQLAKAGESMEADRNADSVLEMLQACIVSMRAAFPNGL